MDFRGKSAVERQIVIFSFYRDAELRGANLLFKLLNHLKDADAQLKMAKHLSDETRHAWLWTKRIADLGGAPILIRATFHDVSFNTFAPPDRPNVQVEIYDILKDVKTITVPSHASNRIS